mmetsp:Transcript_137078/g.382235  ORF Transcript_137078/g.382235 Transcript_137078/m.382235 type:complete len:330 (-) Transcript_137078:703-1692(-)
MVADAAAAGVAWGDAAALHEGIGQAQGVGDTAHAKDHRQRRATEDEAMPREKVKQVRDNRGLASARRCDAENELGPRGKDGIHHQLLDLEGLEDSALVALHKAAAGNEVRSVLEVPEEVEFKSAHGAFPEALLQCDGVLHGQEALLGRVWEFALELLPQHGRCIGEGLHQLVVRGRVRIFLLLLGRVLQLHALAHHVCNLELPRDQDWDILLVNHVHPAGDNGLPLARLAKDHVPDEVLHLEFLFGVQHNLILFALFILLLVVLFVRLLVVFLVFLVVFLVLLVILLIFLVLFILLVLFLLHGRHELAHNLLHVFNTIGVAVYIQIWEF